MSGGLFSSEKVAEDAAASCEHLAAGFADLVIEARGREILPQLSTLASELATRLREHGFAAEAKLASAVASGTDYLFAGEADPGQALLLLASATETLSKAIRLAEARPATLSTTLSAALYELETLFPLQGAPGQRGEPKRNKGGPDVPLHRLRRDPKK